MPKIFLSFRSSDATAVSFDDVKMSGLRISLKSHPQQEEATVYAVGSRRLALDVELSIDATTKKVTTKKSNNKKGNNSTVNVKNPTVNLSSK